MISGLFCRMAIYSRLIQYYRECLNCTASTSVRQRADVKRKIKFFNSISPIFIWHTYHATANCVNVIDIKAYDPTYGETWMFFPDGNGVPQVIDLPTVSGYMRAGGHDDPDSKIYIWLYNQWARARCAVKVKVLLENEIFHTIPQGEQSSRKAES